MDLRNKLNIPLLPGFLLILLTQVVYAQQDKPVMSTGDIQFYMDKAVFAGKEEKSYVEFYFMFFADQVSYNSSDKGELDIEFMINDNSGKKVSGRGWKLEVAVGQKETGLTTKVFYDQRNEYLSPGQYNILVSVRDAISRKSGELKSHLRIPGFPGNALTGSEIEFVSSVSSENLSDTFKKGTKNIVPNPSRRYGVLSPILYMYYELYNIDTIKNGHLEINYNVIAQNSDTAKSYPKVSFERRSPTSGIMHGLNVGNIPSGIYIMNIHVTDLENSSEIILARPFEVIQKDYVENKTSLSTEDSETFEKILSVIGEPGQLKTYKQLPESAKSSYIIEFWKSLDPAPETPENEYLQKIQQRFQYANNKFGWQSTEGWSTERGRVLIKYGMPDEVEMHESEPDTVPYEIWIYRQEKSYHFVFADRQGNGKYILLHSDKEGEISDIRWPEYVRKF